MRGMTMFSGGGGVEALLKDDIDFVAAIEYDAAIADVYRANIGDHVIVGDVCDVDYTQFGRIDYLHASPVCKNASQAKTNGTESDVDIQTAEAVGRALQTLQPRIFTLENVGGYQRFDAYRRICRTLDALGYMWHAKVLNAANYGVPQTRRRLILRAVKDALLPGLPQPQPWIGWYAAIEDLIPTLPASEFAPWQEETLPMKIHSHTLFDQLNYSTQAKREASEPSITVTCYSPKHPAPRAFLVSGGNERASICDSERPPFTIGSSPSTAAGHRAWLQQGRVVKMTPRALARFQSLPDWYVLPKKDKAAIAKLVEQLLDLPKSVADFTLEREVTNNALACIVIGNMVPPLLMREVVRPLL